MGYILSSIKQYLLSRKVGPGIIFVSPYPCPYPMKPARAINTFIERTSRFHYQNKLVSARYSRVWVLFGTHVFLFIYFHCFINARKVPFSTGTTLFTSTFNPCPTEPVFQNTVLRSSMISWLLKKSSDQDPQCFPP